LGPVLVIDTALDACTVGLFVDGAAVWAETRVMARGQEEALGVMAEAAFAETGLKPKSLIRIATTLGPGSFTGLRIGLSFAKGLAAGAGVPVAGFGTLEALGAHQGLRDKRRLIAMDGGRGAIYIQAFATNDKSEAKTIRLDDEDAARNVISGLGDMEVLSGPAADLIMPFIPNAEVVSQQTPSPEALYWLAAQGQPPYETTPIYMREADAKPSTKPKLILDKT
jgi:tRNA threonylcarbamoyladenosine biosynthesis protein TsaB